MMILSEPMDLTMPLFDRSKWKVVRFGDVVELVSETCRDAKKEGIDRYIGLEHLEPGSLHIRTWGELADGITFTKRCRVGQVLFGKRRAYQRKVAVTEFDAVVSGDIYVFQAKADKLDPKLLPFLCMSERFFQFAVETSAGSLSPRTNWSHLAEFEFPLPPLDQQRRIAELLWAVEVLRSSLEEIDMTCSKVEQAIRTRAVTSATTTVTMDDISSVITKGESPGWQGFEYQEDGSLFVTSENVLFDSYSSEPIKYVPLDFHAKIRRSALQQGDVLFNIVGASIGRGCVFPGTEKPANVNQAVAVIRCDKKKALPQFVLNFMLSPEGMKQILGSAVNSARANVSLDSLRKMKVPLLEISVQEKVLAEMSKVRHAKEAARIEFEMLGNIQSVMLANLWTP